MKKLWQKNWTLDEAAELFETQSDLEFDKYLLPFDVMASYAHAKMLMKADIFSAAELEKIHQGLEKILQLDKKNQFSLTFGDEDIHTKIENFLTDQHGEIGEKIHTGRSRNDQVLTAIRLFSKSELLSLWKELLTTAAVFLEFAKQYEFIPMPGYTHMQKAMPSSFGMWASALAEGCVDSITVLEAAYQLNNQSPLGSAASYGVPFPLDRKMTSDLLSFDKVQNNSLYCQNSRGKIESILVSAMCSILFEINKFASDVLLFSTEEFGILDVHEKVCSGSSIMPQKKNVDLAELLRSKIHIVLGNYVQIVSLSTNLPSGYNRDFQDMKKPLIESLLLTKQCLQITQLLVKNISPNLKNIPTQLTPNLFATHFAYDLLKKGIPFRKAYQQAAEALKKNEVHTVEDYLSVSNHLGATGNLQLSQLEKKIRTLNKVQKKQHLHFEKCLSNLFPFGEESSYE